LVIPAAQVAADAIAAAPADTVAQQAARYYVVQSGDTLSGIAQFYYGNGGLWSTIFNANTDKIANPHWIYPNQQLVIPAVAGITGIAVANTSRPGIFQPGLWAVHRAVGRHAEQDRVRRLRQRQHLVGHLSGQCAPDQQPGSNLSGPRAGDTLALCWRGNARDFSSRATL